jgi:hypothetical protein
VALAGVGAVLSQRLTGRAGHVFGGAPPAAVRGMLTAPMATDYRQRVAFIDQAAAALDHRVRVAVALAAADRCFELAVGGIGAAPVEMAVELARLFVRGEDVSVDEASWAWRAVDDAEMEAALDLYEPYKSAAQVVWHLADELRSPEASGGAASSALQAIREAAYQVTGDDGAAEELEWIERALNAAKTGGAPDVALEAVEAEAPPRWLLRALADVQEDEDDPDDMQEQAAALVAARPGAAKTRAARVAEQRRARGAVPRFRARDGIPPALSVREVGKGPDASEGKIAVSGQKHYGVFDENARLLFAPPESAAIGMTADGKTLVSWRVATLPGASGVARGHHRWTLELYAWPGGALTASHVVQSQEMIDGFSPGWIEVPPGRDDGALVVLLRAFNEDARCDLTITRLADGTVGEKTDTVWAD